MSVKVIAGKYKGIHLSVPESARPTLSRNRQALFDMIQSLDIIGNETFGGFFKNKIVIDSFAGSGALGIEALSRGAAHAYFVDNDRNAISIAKSNIAKIKANESSTFIFSDISCIKKLNGKFVDVAFIDPPYEKISIEKVISNLLKQGWISKETLLVIEKSSKKALYNGKKENFSNLEIIKSRKIGNSEFIIARLLKLTSW